MARPSKLTEAVLKKAAEYVATGWVDNRHAVPMIEGLALYIGVHRETASEWAKIPTEQHSEETEVQFGNRVSLHTRYSDIVYELNTKQALELASGALKNKLNAKTANMMLSKHGYIERKEQDLLSGGEAFMPTVRIIDERPRDTDTK